MVRKLDADFVPLHILDSASNSVEQNNAALDRPNDFGSVMPEGARWQKVVRTGNPANEVLIAIEREAIDFVAMPTRSLAPLQAPLFGSVTEKVLHKAQCPVWTEGMESEGAAIHEDILCCVDLGPSSDEVLESASLLATKLGARLRLMHVGHGDAALVELRHLAQRVGVRAECVVRSGEVAVTILDEVEVKGADLLVMGRGEERSLTGRVRSHAQSVIQKSHCAVLSV